MKNISSVQKGDILEKKTFELIKELLKNDEFFVSGKRSEIYLKKPYFSVKRQGDIIFDISIETSLLNSKSFSILTLIECKNLKDKVSIDDIEEFSSKISQIGEHNTKGVFITTSGFQKSAFNYAKAQGISLVRISSSDKLDWINYRKEKLYGQEQYETHKLNFFEDNVHELFVGLINNKLVDNLADLLIESKVIDTFEIKESFIKIPFVSLEYTKYIVERLANRNVYTDEYLDTDKIIELMTNVYDVSFEFEQTLPSNLLGKIEFDPLKIYVSAHLKENQNRWRFTLLHEIGHLILHSKLFSGLIDEVNDSENTVSISKHEVKRIEFQANVFASHVLLPHNTLSFFVNQYFLEIRNRKGKLHLDHHSYNQELVYTLLNRISLSCKVSIEVIKIRLVQLDLLIDKTDTSLKTIYKQRNI